MDIPISKKGHNSGTPVPNLTKQMSCHAHLIFISIMYSNFHAGALTILVQVIDWKRQRKKTFVTCFRDVAVVLEQSQDFQNFT